MAALFDALLVQFDRLVKLLILIECAGLLVFFLHQFLLLVGGGTRILAGVLLRLRFFRGFAVNRLVFKRRGLLLVFLLVFLLAQFTVRHLVPSVVGWSSLFVVGPLLVGIHDRGFRVKG